MAEYRLTPAAERDLESIQPDPLVLTLWGRPRRAKVLYPVAGLPCRGGEGFSPAGTYDLAWPHWVFRY